MNLKELEKVSDIINNLGEQSLEGLLYYLGFDMFTTIIGYVIVLILVICVYKISNKLIQNLVQPISILKEIREILEIGRPGELTNSETEEIVDKIKMLKRERG